MIHYTTIKLQNTTHAYTSNGHCVKNLKIDCVFSSRLLLVFIHYFCRAHVGLTSVNFDKNYYGGTESRKHLLYSCAERSSQCFCCQNTGVNLLNIQTIIFHSVTYLPNVCIHGCISHTDWISQHGYRSYFLLVAVMKFRAE